MERFVNSFGIIHKEVDKVQSGQFFFIFNFQHFFIFLSMNNSSTNGKTLNDKTNLSDLKSIRKSRF